MSSHSPSCRQDPGPVGVAAPHTGGADAFRTSESGIHRDVSSLMRRFQSRLCAPATGMQRIKAFLGSAPHQSSRLTTSEGRARPWMSLCASGNAHRAVENRFVACAGLVRVVRASRLGSGIQRKQPARRFKLACSILSRFAHSLLT
jgi:hypothetical protein